MEASHPQSEEVSNKCTRTSVQLAFSTFLHTRIPCQVPLAVDRPSNLNRSRYLMIDMLTGQSDIDNPSLQDALPGRFQILSNT